MTQQQDLAQLYEETFKTLEEGTVVEGTIIAVRPDGVMVDIGYKAEGLVSREEFSQEEFAAAKAGDRLRIYLEARENHEGNLVLSKERAGRMEIWDKMRQLFEQGAALDGKVISKIKGGLIVDIGVKAFLPGSQADIRPTRQMDHLIGRSFPMKIIKLDHRRGNVVVSRRAYLEESREQRRQTTLAGLEEGKVIQGTVKNITEYGAFVDMGGLDGLLHITDMSWGRIGHPSEVVRVGDRIEVVVLKYDHERGRVSLGLKQRTPDPWSRVVEKYPVGNRIQGRVVSLTEYGAFVELEPGVEGLVHVSEMSWSHEIRDPSKVVSVSQMVEAVVLNVDGENRRISLGMKQLGPNPWDQIAETYPVGSRITGTIKTVTDFGAFVGLAEGIDGLIHVSDISWTKRLSHPSEMFRKGQPVEAVVLKVDKEKERLSLGYKQLTPDPWETVVPAKYPIGTHVQGKVVKVADFGVFVEMEDGIEGLIHASELGASPRVFKTGADVWAKVIRVDLVERKMALSIKEYQREQERAQVDEFHTRQPAAADQMLGAASRRRVRGRRRSPNEEGGDGGRGNEGRGDEA